MHGVLKTTRSSVGHGREVALHWRAWILSSCAMLSAEQAAVSLVCWPLPGGWNLPSPPSASDASGPGSGVEPQAGTAKAANTRRAAAVVAGRIGWSVADSRAW